MNGATVKNLRLWFYNQSHQAATKYEFKKLKQNYNLLSRPQRKEYEKYLTNLFVKKPVIKELRKESEYQTGEKEIKIIKKNWFQKIIDWIKNIFRIKLWKKN